MDRSDLYARGQQHHKAVIRFFPDGRVHVSARRVLKPGLAPFPRDVEVERERTERRAKANVRWRCESLGADHLLTLTYRENLENLSISRDHLRQYLRSIRKVDPSFKCVAVAERQKRGSIHWHIAVKGFQNVNRLRALWHRTIFPYDGNIDVQFYRTRGRFTIAQYIAKYIGKGFDGVRPRYDHHYTTSRGIVVNKVVHYAAPFGDLELRDWLEGLITKSGAAVMSWWVREDGGSAGCQSW